MKKNNRGFSLVELMVSMVILGIVAIGALGLMSTGSNSYRRIMGNVDMQYKSQLAMNNIQECLIDCNAGVCFEDSTLYIVDGTDSVDAGGNITTSYVIHIFRYDDASGSIFYGRNDASTDDGGMTFTASDAAADLLSDAVTGFSATLTGDAAVSDAAVSITFSLSGQTFTGEQTIALRNSPPQVTVLTS